MKVLLYDVPSREANGSIPFGLMAAANVAKKAGCHVKVVDLTLDQLTLDEVARQVAEFQPSVIGFGGITSSYRNLKPLSLALKERFPDIPLVCGGVITSVHDLLLQKAAIDVCFLGEAEYSFKEFLQRIAGGQGYRDVPGIAYLENGEVRKNPHAPQIKNLDEVGIPPYELLDMNRYIVSTRRWVDIYQKSLEILLKPEQIEQLVGRYPTLFAIQSSRGCTHACSFCYRHMRGVRQQSVEFVLGHMQYLIDHLGIRFFQFNDELTIVTKKWVMKFCEEIQRRGMDIRFIILSARSCTVDDEMLAALKKSGCVVVNYGFESGSDEVLKAMGKGTTRQDNINAGLLTQKNGIVNVPEMIIGFPEDSDRSVDEAISFIKALDADDISLNFALPFPNTPLWEYCMKHGLIKDYEEFILSLGNASVLRVNMTRYPDEWLFKSRIRFRRDIKVAYLLKRRHFSKALYYWVYYTLSLLFPRSIKARLKSLVRLFSA